MIYNYKKKVKHQKTLFILHDKLTIKKNIISNIIII